MDKAIKSLAWMGKIFEPPVYCYHEIVHNKLVVEAFEAQGVVFVDDIDEVPNGSPLMLSAHGTAPDVAARARTRGRVVVDAVCPLVTKVHKELKTKASKGYTVLYVGHKGHEEAIGTMAVAPDNARLIESVEDVRRLAKQLDPAAPLALLTQTTLSMDEWSEIREEAKDNLPGIWIPERSDLCFATTNRQTALRAIAQRSDTLVVLGSSNSSNTRALEQVARNEGVANVLRINEAAELPDDLSGTVGVTAGASAPDQVVQQVVSRLSPRLGVEEVSVGVEDEYFPPPPELRQILKALSTALSLTPLSAATGETTGAIGFDDRSVEAADSLATLGSVQTPRPVETTSS